MLECPSCSAAVHESNPRCLRCGQPISPNRAKTLPRKATRYREGALFWVVSAVLVLGVLAGIGYGTYRTYRWWTFKKNSEKVAKLTAGRHPGGDYPLFGVDFDFRVRESNVYLIGTAKNAGRRFIADVVYRYSCIEPALGSTFSLGSFHPGQERRFEVFLFPALRVDTCASYIDHIDITQ